MIICHRKIHPIVLSWWTLHLSIPPNAYVCNATTSRRRAISVVLSSAALTLSRERLNHSVAGWDKESNVRQSKVTNAREISTYLDAVRMQWDDADLCSPKRSVASKIKFEGEKKRFKSSITVLWTMIDTCRCNTLIRPSIAGNLLASVFMNRSPPFALQ